MSRILKIAGLVGVVLVSALFAVAWKVSLSLEPSTDIDDYQRALKSVPVKLVEHFPKVISAEPKTRFYYLPGFLQGGTRVQLLTDASAINVSEIRAQYAGKAAKQWRGCRKTGNSADTVSPAQRPSAEERAVCDYNVYILQATPPEQWNHGHESGVAVSASRQEVLYWANVW